MEERVGVGDSILLIVHSPVETAALLKSVCLRPVLNKSRLIAGQSQLVHLRVGRIPNADGRTAERGEQSVLLSVCSNNNYDTRETIIRLQDQNLTVYKCGQHQQRSLKGLPYLE